MKDSVFSRRDALKWGGLATGALGGWDLRSFGNGTAEGNWMRPAEASTLYSKEYGRKRIQKIQTAIKRADLDALVIANRCLDYISYVSNRSEESGVGNESGFGG